MKKYRIEIKWTIVFVVMTLLWMIGEKMTGLHDENIEHHLIYTNFYAIPAIAVYVLALLDKRKNDFQGIMTYKQGVVTGLVITVMITLLSPLTQYITSVVITPEYFPNVIAHVVQEGMLSQQEAEAQFNLSNYIFQSVVGALVMGILTSLIVAFFVSKKAIREDKNDLALSESEG
jgi:hypothetical protein